MTTVKSTSADQSIPQLSFQEAMLNRLRSLADKGEKLKQYPNDPGLKEKAGYAALHAARYATEMIFRATHGVEDVTPELTGPEAIPASLKELRKLLRQVRSNDGNADPLKAMAIALHHQDDPFEVATACIQTGWSLLGPHRLGGLMSAWQTPVLAFDWMTWREHVDFNKFILERAKEIYRPTADEAAFRYDLPTLDYLKAGSHGNIAKAAYRAVAEKEDEAERREALEIGHQAMKAIEEQFSQETRNQLLFSTMLAMRASCAQSLGDEKTARSFWSKLDSNEKDDILSDLKRIEPSSKLIALVRVSSSRVS